MKILPALVIAVVITAVVAGAAGYLAAPTQAPGAPVPTVTITPTAPGPEGQKLKVAFLYIGPIEGSGWNTALDSGRQYVDDTYDAIETIAFEDIIPGDVSKVIETAIEQGADVIVSTAFDFIVETADMAEKTPDKIFYQLLESSVILEFLISEGYVMPSNMGLYHSELHQTYYLNGLLAGALTKTDKLGYLLPHTISETVRNLNAFAIGAREVNPDAEVKVIQIGSWYDPPTEALATQTLIDSGVDVINGQMDGPAYIIEAQKYYEETGNVVLTFGANNPMWESGEDVVLSGCLLKWEKCYEPLLLKALYGEVESSEHTGLIKEGGTVWGYDFGVPISPKFVNEAEETMVTVPVEGTISIYDLAMLRNEQFKDPRVAYEVFKGPMRDSDGTLRLQDGETMSTMEFLVTIDWFVEGVIPP